MKGGKWVLKCRGQLKVTGFTFDVIEAEPAERVVKNGIR